jgi:hypothetical protein
VTAPDWLTPGARVAIIHHRRNVEFDTVDRVLKSQVVLTSGRRFSSKKRSAAFSEVGYRGDTWNPAPTLASPDDPRVVKILQLDRARAIQDAVNTAATAWRITPTQDHADALIDAIGVWKSQTTSERR